MTALDTKALLTGVTPGDWEAHPDGPADWCIMAVTKYDDEDETNHDPVCSIPGLELSGDYDEANARLIASAPRLARRVIELEEALAEARPVVEAMTGTEWAGVGKFNCWQKADDSLRAIKAKIEAALKGEGE